MKSFLKIWVKLKCWYAKKRGWINPLSKELSFVQALTDDQLQELKKKYKKDLLLNCIPWDWQFDSIETFKRGGADCNSIHRVWQVHEYLQGRKAWLVSYIAKPFIKSHTTCIIEDQNGKFYSMDYGNRGVKRYDSINKCLCDISNKYTSIHTCYVKQDINWEVIE